MRNLKLPTKTNNLEEEGIGIPDFIKLMVSVF